MQGVLPQPSELIHIVIHIPRAAFIVHVIWNSGTGKNIHLLLEFVQTEDGIHGTAFIGVHYFMYSFTTCDNLITQVSSEIWF